MNGGGVGRGEGHGVGGEGVVWRATEIIASRCNVVGVGAASATRRKVAGLLYCDDPTTKLEVQGVNLLGVRKAENRGGRFGGRRCAESWQ